MRLVTFGIVVVLSLSVPKIAGAQTGNSADVLIDLSRERDSARQADPSGLTPQQRGALTNQQFEYLGQRSNKECLKLWSHSFLTCELDIIVPFTFASNPLGTPTQSDDGHTKPDISLHFATGKPGEQMFVLSGYVDLAFNRYIVNTSVDADTLRLWLGGSYSPSPPISLYVGYRPVFTYTEGFGDLATTFHDVLAGVNLMQQTVFSTSHRMTLTLDLNAGHRTADPDKFSAAIGALAVTGTYKYCPTSPNPPCAPPIFSIVAKPSLNMTWYDNSVAGQARHDMRPGVTMTASWWPWHKSTSALNGISVVMIASFARNDSNISNRSFTSWDVGPALKWALGQSKGIEPSGLQLKTSRIE